ncbi:hypothetical protein BHE74_00052722 [Ensete ventricosum]|nr:hypothetical protein BHE74_00052722 [Ensete ventricosum]
MKQPVEVLAKCHVNQAARPHKRQKMMYGRHSHCESFSSQGSELEGMQPQGEGAGQGTGPCRAPASEVDAGAMPYFYRRQGRRLPRPLHDRPIGWGLGRPLAALVVLHEELYSVLAGQGQRHKVREVVLNPNLEFQLYALHPKFSLIER